MSDHDSHEGGLDAFTVSEDLVQSPQHKQATTNEFDFDGLLDGGLKLHEDLASGNGGQAWPAGRVLATYLLRRRRGDLKDCTMLAIALGCRPSHVVHITDQAPMLPLMQRNIALNRLEGRAEATVYDWGSSRPHRVPLHPDVILAADCVYFEPAFPLLRQTLQDLIGPNSVCYFCFKKRRRADMSFMKAVRKILHVEEVTDDPDRDNYLRESIFL
ncbi:hypothetical protein BAUCODRAFT_68802 [Baudoinia panamericana UAMH 10762]|uniref:Elongation factor methyltransferase 6 n=1 Tax=Baudoinia panamericana (strain UAMH 10762) TaxID=717646 RepID=M2NF07_BAUPA|nr:uncharacterized protein BAUCODRAFT_68802 [Baudoinia panamericana UAMH 10762]EMC97545.1 hypothetical protein BAUCODRAFT_68802 [Baudoinia panamericana UAMH 10762]